MWRGFLELSEADFSLTKPQGGRRNLLCYHGSTFQGWFDPCHFLQQGICALWTWHALSSLTWLLNHKVDSPIGQRRWYHIQCTRLLRVAIPLFFSYNHIFTYEVIATIQACYDVTWYVIFSCYENYFKNLGDYSNIINSAQIDASLNTMLLGKFHYISYT